MNEVTQITSSIPKWVWYVVGGIVIILLASMIYNKWKASEDKAQLKEMIDTSSLDQVIKDEVKKDVVEVLADAHIALS